VILHVVVWGVKNTACAVKISNMNNLWMRITATVATIMLDIDGSRVLLWCLANGDHIRTS
jgi:hypothetical protein